MAPPPLGSILLASTDPARLRSWYASVFGVEPNPDGFLQFGGVGVLIDERDDVAERTVEPGRVILNFHVDDIQDAADRLRMAGATFLVEPEFRGPAWFATAADPDGNLIQIIEFTPEYFTSRGLPAPDHAGGRRR